MVFRRLTVWLVLFAAALSTANLGCAEKKTRTMKFEGPESEVKLEMETTDKNPDDDDDD